MHKPHFIFISTRKILYISALILILFVLSLIVMESSSTGRAILPIISDIFNWEKVKPESQESYLAIIIDDFGSGRNGVNEMMSIDRHLTFAVMPFCEHSKEDAENAYQKGYEVIVHLPMEPNKGKPSWLGKNPILSGMKAEQVKSIVEAAFDSVPYAVGANIHMGSKASSEEQIVSAILEEIKSRNLYFVDSCTAAKPIAKKIADQEGVLCYDRDVFLDGQQPKGFVRTRLLEACKTAEEKGYAIAIGHVGIEGGKVTAEVINELLPVFEERNIKLVFVSELSELIR